MKRMKLADLKVTIDKAVEYAARTDPNVEFWMGENVEVELLRVSQFSVVPTVVFWLKSEAE